MARTVSATEARVHFGDLLRRVSEERETVFVERNGKRQVAVLPADEYDRLRQAGLERVLNQVDRDLVAWGSKASDTLAPSADEVIREMREERDAQLTR